LDDPLHENTSLNELKYRSGIVQTKLRPIKINIYIPLHFHTMQQTF